VRKLRRRAARPVSPSLAAACDNRAEPDIRTSRGARRCPAGCCDVRAHRRVAAFSVAAGAKPHIKADYDHSTSFAAYKTFGIVSPPATEVDGYPAEITETFRKAVRAEMEKRGYKFSESNPDLLVNFSALLAKKTGHDTLDKQEVGYYGYRQGERVPIYKTWSTHTYDKGTKEYVEGRSTSSSRREGEAARLGRHCNRRGAIEDAPGRGSEPADREGGCARIRAISVQGRPLKSGNAQITSAASGASCLQAREPAPDARCPPCDLE
jgi:hypothetical protein